jgi:hypothetical protein
VNQSGRPWTSRSTASTSSADEHDRIRSFTVMARPMAALMAFDACMYGERQ